MLIWPCPSFPAFQVQNTLVSGNFLGVINVLMQLRKVWQGGAGWGCRATGPLMYLSVLLS